jgi:hypothetical protein
MADEKKKEIPLHRERLVDPKMEELKKLGEARRKQITSDMAFCFGTVQGRNALRFILNLCGYKQPKIGGNPALGLDILHGTFYNATREQIALEILEFIPDYIQKDVEHGNSQDLE